MKYRKLGKTGVEVSALGFGCMRLPTAENDPNSPNITEGEAARMLHSAIERGVNYVDTAYRYHSGASETFLRKALGGDYRQKVHLATKSPMMMIKTAGEFDRILDEQLGKLGVDHIDFYLLHALNAHTWGIVQREDILSHAEKAQKAGKIGHIAFSFHDSYDVFASIVSGYDKWALCQIQYNIMDVERQAGTKGLELAASKGLGVVVMEPLRGGKLAVAKPEAAAVMKKYGYDAALVELALRWVWNHSEVSLALSGMTTMEQLDANLMTVERALPDTLSESELKLVEEIREVYDRKAGIPCTACSYCTPCPQGIPIPRVFSFYNESIIYEHSAESRRMYGLFGGEVKNCTKCGACEKKCPQEIHIREWLEKAEAALG